MSPMSMIIKSYWRGKYLLIRPTTMVPSSQKTITATQFFGPSGCWLRFIIQSKYQVITSIPPLLFFGCPANVFRPFILKTFTTLATGIMAVIVNTIYGILWCRFRSNISKKVSERCFVSTAYTNTTTAIFRITDIGRRAASASYAVPGLVLRCGCYSLAASSPSTSVLRDFFMMPTPARHRGACSKVCTRYRNRRPTFTNAVPPALPVTSVWGSRYNSKSSERWKTNHIRCGHKLPFNIIELT